MIPGLFWYIYFRSLRCIWFQVINSETDRCYTPQPYLLRAEDYIFDTDAVGCSKGELCNSSKLLNFQKHAFISKIKSFEANAVLLKCREGKLWIVSVMYSVNCVGVHYSASCSCLFWMESKKGNSNSSS